MSEFDALLAKAQELIAVSTVKRLEAKSGDYVVVEFAEGISSGIMAITAQRWRPVLEKVGLVPIFIPPGCKVTGFIPAFPEPAVEGEMEHE